MASVGGSPADSLYKVQTTGKSVRSTASNPNDSISVETQVVYPVDGYTAPPAVTRPDDSQYTADYYRNGSPNPNDTTLPGAPPRTIFPHGIQKDYDGDKVTASIRIRGKDRKKGNQEVDYIPGYTKFILEAVNESYSERNQVVETFGDFYAFFFGQRPSVFNLSGTLINSKNVNWVQDFMFFYENFLRGTKSVERRARAVITYGGRQIEGFIINTQNQTNAVSEEGVPFSFQVLVTGRNFLGFSDDFSLVRGLDGSLVSDSTLQSIVDQIAGPTGKGESNPEVDSTKNTVQNSMKGMPPLSYNVA